MRKVYRVIPFCSVAGLLFLSAGEAHAQPYPIPDLYNTGVSDGPAPAGSGPPLSPGAADPHYTIVSGSTDGSNDPSPALGAATVNDNSYPTHTTAAWIGPGNTGEDQSGVAYDYQTNFSLPEGAIAVNITCDVDVDNAMTEVLVNGNIVPFSSPLYQQLTGTDGEGLTNHNIATEIPISFGVPSEDLSLSNTLTFVTVNQPDTPTGFLVDNIQGTYVPEPASTGVLFVAAFGLLNRRLRRQKACSPSST